MFFGGIERPRAGRAACVAFLAAAIGPAAGCRKPDRGTPQRDGPGVIIVEVPDAEAAGAVRPDARAPGDRSFCVEEWRVSVPPEVTVRDVAWAADRPALLLERSGTFLAAVVGDGGQTTVAVLQDFVPEYTAGRSPWGRLVSGPERAMAVYGWVKPRDSAVLFGRGIRPTGDLSPSGDDADARRRYLSAEPSPSWELRGDPTVAESRVWTTPVEKRFLVLVDLWRGDRLEAGRLRPVQKHMFAIFGATGRKAAGWEMPSSRGAGPAPVGDLVVVALASDERTFDVLDRTGRRQSGVFVDALRALPDRVPVGGGPAFVLLAQPGAGAAGIPPLEAVAPDGTRSAWLVPEALRGASTIDGVAGNLLWGLEPDGAVWAADSSGRLVAHAVLPEGADPRRYSEDGSRIVAGLRDAQGRLAEVISCVPGGIRPEPARAVPLGGSVEQARRDLGAGWNDVILSALDAVEEAASAAAPPSPERLGRLVSFDALRIMATRAAALDSDLLIVALSRARIEMLAGDPVAALMAFRPVMFVEPARRDRLYLLVCKDDRFRALRWHSEIGAAIGCPAAAPEWSLRPLPLPGAAPMPVVPSLEPPPAVPAPPVPGEGSAPGDPSDVPPAAVEVVPLASPASLRRAGPEGLPGLD